jgi:predicted RNase H-like nuclease (RuvC/YqgF family)
VDKDTIKDQDKGKGDEMDEQMTQQLTATAERLAIAAEALDRVLERLDSQQEALNAKVDRIVAAVEERTSQDTGTKDNDAQELQKRVIALENPMAS